MASLTGDILAAIEAGHLEKATRLVQTLGSLIRDPAICTQETLAALQRARNLAIVQRSHIQRRLSSLAASRLYGVSPQTDRITWQIEG